MTKTEKILAAVQKWQNTVTGKLGFAYFDFETGESCFLHEDTPFPTASVFKVFLLAELYRQVEAGVVKLDDVLHIDPATVSGGSGALKRFRHSADLTVYNLAVLMMMISDNTATDLLFSLVGPENIQNNILTPLGLTNTQVHHNCVNLIRYSKLAAKERAESRLREPLAGMGDKKFYNYTSPRDMAKMLRSLHDATILTKESCEEVLELMQPYPKYSRLEKYLPHGTKVRRKTGSLDRVANDVGIVFTEKGDYVIAVFYNGNDASEEEYRREIKKLMAEELIARVSEDVYSIHMED